MGNVPKLKSSYIWRIIMNTFIPQQLGITAFMESNRIDFVLEGPEQKKLTCSVFYVKAKSAKIPKLDDKKLTWVTTHKNPEGRPAQIEIKWDRKTLKLGRRWKAQGKTSFYTSLENGGGGASPQSDDAIMAALEQLNA
jgi:hypothetical protein